MRKSTKTKHMLFLACAAGVFAIGRAMPAQAATNLLLDPDFEVADGGQDASGGDAQTRDAFDQANGPWNGWCNWAPPYDAAFYDNFAFTHPGATVTAHSGSQVGKTYSGPNCGIWQNVVGAVPGDTYQGSGWFLNFSGDQLTNPAISLDVRIIFHDSGGNTISTVVAPVPFGPIVNSPLDTWTQLSVSAVAPAGAASVEWMAFMANPNNGGGAMFVDDASLFDLGSGPVTATWNGAGADANWSNGLNWGGTAPSATNSLAFGGTTNLTPTNNFPAGLQFNGIKFNSGAGAFTVSGNAINLGGDVVNNSINLQTIGIAPTLLQNTNFNAATGDIAVSGAIGGAGFGITKIGTGTLTLSGANTYTGATTVTAGTLSLTVTGTVASSSGVSVGAGATPAAMIFQAGGTGTHAYTVAGLSIGSNGAVTVATSGTLGVNHTVLVTPILSFAGGTGGWTGKLDLTNNDLIVQAGGAASLANITNQLKQGFNAAAHGYWNGTAGIVSAAAAGNTRHLTTLGSRLSGGSPFDGVNTTTSDVLVKYTYYGDADLSGTVDGADYTQIDHGFGMHLTGWQNGDFNYDGVVDGSDYTLIDNTFNQISATGASPLALLASPAEITTAVPEPTAFGLIGIAAISLMRRSRRETTAQLR